MRHSRFCGCWPRTTAGASRRPIRTPARTRRFNVTRLPLSFSAAREGQRGVHVLVIPEQVPAHPGVQALGRLLGEPDSKRLGAERACPPRVAEDLVLERRERLVGAGVALPAAAARELPIDAAGFVELG